MFEKYDLEEVEKKLEGNPKDAQLWYKKGMALGDLGRYDECRIAFSRGLALAPFDPHLRLQRGRKFITSDEYPVAIADLVLATRLDPEDWEHWYYLGVACFLDDDFESAKEYHATTIKLMQKNKLPDLAAAVCWYWQSCMKLGQEEEAREILELVDEDTLIGINMDYKERVLLHQGKRDPEVIAKEEYYKDTDRPVLYRLTVLFSIAMHYYYLGDIEKSNDYLRQVYEIPEYHESFCYKQTLREMKERNLL